MTKSDVAYLQGRMFVGVLCIGVIAVPAFLVGFLVGRISVKRAAVSGDEYPDYS
jgi:hypothetical protein